MGRGGRHCPSRLARTWPIRSVVDVDGGQRVGDRPPRPGGPRGSSGGRRRPRRPDRGPTGLRRTSSTPASMRVMSRRLVTRRVRRSVSTSMRPCSSSVSASESGHGGSSRVEEATFMVASGVRRSCDTAPTRACRRRSTSSSSSERSACSRSWARSRARAAWLAKVRSSARSAVGGRQAPDGQHARPDGPTRTGPRSGSVRDPAGRPRLTGIPDCGIELVELALARAPRRPRRRSPADRPREAAAPPRGRRTRSGPRGRWSRADPRPSGPRPGARTVRRGAGSRPLAAGPRGGPTPGGRRPGPPAASPPRRRPGPPSSRRCPRVRV